MYGMIYVTAEGEKMSLRPYRMRSVCRESFQAGREILCWVDVHSGVVGGCGWEQTGDEVIPGRVLAHVGVECMPEEARGVLAA